jgi:hypothetical protein
VVDNINSAASNRFVMCTLFESSTFPYVRGAGPTDSNRSDQGDYSRISRLYASKRYRQETGDPAWVSVK